MYSTLIEKIIAETKVYSPKLIGREYLSKAQRLGNNLAALESEILKDTTGRIFITRFAYQAESFSKDLQYKIYRAAFFFLIIRQRPRFTLFPYTTLFRAPR